MDNKQNNKRSFYIAIMLGLFAIGTLTYTISGVKQASEKLASINKAKNSLEESSDMKIGGDISSNYKVKKDNLNKGNLKNKESQENDNSSKKKTIKREVTAKEVINNSSKLLFNEEIGLSWPVKGEVIKKYSVDRLVYFPTLGVFKVNPAIFIAAKKGDDVKASYKGIINEVGESKEIGKYVELGIGNDYKLIYGQLDDIQVKKGDNIEEDVIIGKVAEPSSYYQEEGCHIYFKVIQNGETVDPLLLLR